jgi:hypothetical protein
MFDARSLLLKSIKDIYPPGKNKAHTSVDVAFLPPTTHVWDAV